MSVCRINGQLVLSGLRPEQRQWRFRWIQLCSCIKIFGWIQLYKIVQLYKKQFALNPLSHFFIHSYFFVASLDESFLHLFHFHKWWLEFPSISRCLPLGRTGRVGNLGKATSFIDTEGDGDVMPKLVDMLTKVNIFRNGLCCSVISMLLARFMI